MKVQHAVHEYGPNSQHRIVLVDSDGDVHPGPWASYDGIALNTGHFAATEYWADTLPTGVFKCSSVPHKTITG